MPLSLRTYPTIGEAGAALTTGSARYLGGGTLAVRAANEGDLSFDLLVRSSDPALQGIAIAAGSVRLGAAVTMAAIARHDGLAAIAPAARAIGGPAIRNMATVGGNLFAPTPYGDFAVALLALGATVEAGGGAMDLEELLAARDRFRGIVASVSFPLPPPGAFRFVKVALVKPNVL
jgi:CO/xanthine dehydrogenase FAD-binding subunit